MKDHPFEVLSALADGEVVDPQAVAAALQEDGADEFLMETAKLRWVVAESERHPGERFYERLPQALRGVRGSVRRGAPWWAAAALLAALLSVPLWHRPSTPAHHGPPLADRVVQLEPSNGGQR